MATLEEVAKKFNITPKQVKDLRVGMATTTTVSSSQACTTQSPRWSLR